MLVFPFIMLQQYDSYRSGSEERPSPVQVMITGTLKHSESQVCGEQPFIHLVTAIAISLPGFLRQRALSYLICKLCLAITLPLIQFYL